MKTFATLAAVAAAIAVVPAAAQDAVEIYFGDLDVASAAGTQVLGERLEAGADTICVRPDNRNLKGMVAWKECKEAVVTSGVEQLASKGIQLDATLIAAN